jgi:hypothetical protein
MVLMLVMEGRRRRKKSNLARRLGVGQKTTYEEVTKIPIKASLRAVVCHEQAIVFRLKCVGDHTYSCDRCVK